MHPLWGLHEPLPRLSPQRWLELRRDLFGPDRAHHRPDVQRAQIQQPAVLFDAQWQLLKRLPGQDQHPRADLRLAPRAREAPRGSLRQKGDHEGGRRTVVASYRLSSRRRRADTALAHLPRFVIYNGLNAWGEHREVPQPPKQTFHSWYLANRGGAQ